MQNRIGPRPGHTEECRSRMEGEIDKLTDDDRLKRVKERQDHFAAVEVEKGDARQEDPRQQDTNEPAPHADEAADVAAHPTTPAGAKKSTIFFDIGSPGMADAEMGEEEARFEDGPAGSSDRRLLTPVRILPNTAIPIELDDAPVTGGERRIRSPVRRPPTKRRAQTGDMFTHDDEPSTEKVIVDEPDDQDADLGGLVIAHPGVGVSLLGKVGGQDKDRVIAAPEVGVLLTAPESRPPGSRPPGS